MKCFVIFLILVGFVGSFLFGNNAYAIWWPLSPEELIEQSGTIFVGTVTDVTPVDIEYQSQVARNGTIKESIGPEVITLDEYTVNVEEYLKNPQNSNAVTVLQATVPGVPGSPAKIGGFEIGDRVLFYLPEKYTTDSSRQYLPESFELPEQCDGKDVLMQKRLYGGQKFAIKQDRIEFDGFKKKEYLNFTANNGPIQFVYGYDAKTMAGKSFDIDMVVSKLDSNGLVQKTVFNQTIKAQSKPCEWIAHANWEFVPKEGGSYQVTGIAKNIDEHHPIERIIGSFIDVSVSPKGSMSPLQQFKSGIPINEIQCKEELVLITKSSDGSPVCVNPETKQKLIDRRWAKSDSEETHLTPIIPELGKIGTYELQKGNKTYDIPYHIKGGSDIKEIFLDDDSRAINIVLKQYDSGSLEITLPRELIDAKISEDVDDLFFVLIDGEEVPYDETTNETSRTLTIQFEKESKIIEIIGVMPI